VGFVQARVSEWSLSTLPSPIPELQQAPLLLKMLWTKECASTPPSDVFFLDNIWVFQGIGSALGMLPRGNIILYHMVTFIWCHMSTHYYVIKWWVCRYPHMPSLHHMYKHTHTPKYASYTPPNIQIHVFIYKNYTSLNPRPHGGIQMP
jgi:hypothetical protein